MTSRRPFLGLLAGMLLAAGAAQAQSDYATATLKGMVTDPTEKVVVGAKITAINQATGATRSAATNAEGYLIQALTPGVYRVETSAQGFARSVAKDIVLNVGQTAVYDVQLRVGFETSIIEVSSELPMSRPEETQQSNIINDLQVENLPNITRNFVQSIYTVPGVNNSYAPALQNPGVGTGYLSSGFSIGAGSGRSNLVTIDGGENDYGSGTQRVAHVPIDSIQEFQINRSSFGSEFGYTVGSAINMVTRSGTNQFHGTGAGYFRNRATDSPNYFNRLADPNNEPFEQTAIFSATLGGPIRKNSLFFFTAPEYQRLDSATVQNISGRSDFQPVSAQTNGFNPATGACPNQGTPQQQVTQLCYLTQLSNSGGALGALGSALLGSPTFGNPMSNPILKALVSSNEGTFNGIISGGAGSGERGIPGFNTPRGRYFNWVSRIDYTPGQKDTLSLRFSLMKETDSTRPEPQFSGFESQSDYTLTGSWTRAIGPRTSNTVRVQAVPQNTFLVHPPAPVGSEIDLGTVQLGTPFSYPYDAHWKRFQFDDNLSHVVGSHNLKFGGSWRPDYYSLREEVWPHGQWQFTDGAYSILNIVGIAQGEAAAGALAAFNISRGYPATGPSSTNLTAVQSYLAGAPTVLFQAAENSNPLWQSWAQDVGFYAQDSWKVSRRLNVNYGVRIDYYHDPAPVPPSTQFSPRLGIAWSLDAKQRTVIRAGGGRFVAPTPFIVPVYTNLLGADGKHINQNALVAGLPSPPFPSIFAAWALQASLATPAFPNPGLNTAQLASIGAIISPPGPGAFGNLIFTQGPNFKPAYSIQASFSVTREIVPNLSLDLAYLMYRSVHVDKSVEVNFVHDSSSPVDPFVGPMYVPKPGTTNGQPNAFIFQNNASSSIGTGIYHGGTASLTRRFKRSLQFQVNYTFSRAIDDTSDYSSLSSPFRPETHRLERALSSFNISHNFVANAVYAVPSHAGSGAARWLLRDLTISPIVYVRSGVPFTLLVPGLSNGTVGHNANARPWYASRNSGLGARFVSWDMRVSKMLFGKEGGTRLDFIAQGQNLLNRTNFAVVNANFPADANYPLPGGGTLGKGPYSVHAFAPKAVSELSTPLAYTSAYPARQISLALKLAF